MKLFSNLFRKKTLEDHLDQTRVVFIYGVEFRIRKVNVLDHLHGAKVLTASYDQWRSTKQKNPTAEFNDKKMKEHHKDVFMQCVLEPKLCRKEEEAGIGVTWVDRIFLDWDIASGLYQEIMEFTYGKKKVRQALSQFS